MNRKATAGLAAAALALTGGGAVAYAGAGYPTKLTIGYSKSSGGFAGNLNSHAGCVDGRKVVVYRKQGGSDQAVGGDKVKPNGKWAVTPGKVKAGDYYAETAAVTLKNGGKCASAKTPATHVS
ncbi:MAG: hypothetical protein U0R51_03670 [Solirubrobacterales bacterium]